ncbi:MAG: response regulator [Micrococcales bacterium]|nr:response regulator [Micrococcales bacterium]OJX69801.1 MAG: hypothetical protein BGO94_15155 [Micrococcales bacterium 72-143]
MYVSIEVLTTIGSFTGLLVAIVAGFGWTIRRSDAQLQQLGDRLDGRIDRLEERLDARIDRLEERFDVLTHEVIEIKIAVARLEGPLPRLVPAR